MGRVRHGLNQRRNVWSAVAWGVSIAALASVIMAGASLGAQRAAHRGAAAEPYANMPSLSPIGVRVDRYAEVPDHARGPAIDPAKGYRLQTLGDGLYMITDGAYQSMFMVYEDGVVVVDAPPFYGSKIRTAVAEVTANPITHLIYSHAHRDHIGGARALGGTPVIIAHAETNRLLAREKDPDRPPASVTFDTEHRLAVAQDVHGFFEQVGKINAWDFDTFVGGHVARTGTHEDVATQLAFMTDLKGAAQAALQRTAPGDGLDPADRGNPWALFDHYIDRVVVDCVNQLTPKWASKLAAFDVYVWDQCYSMEQSLRID